MPDPNEDFDFEKYSEAFEKEFEVTPLDSIAQAQEELRQHLVPAVKTIIRIAEHSDNEVNAYKAAVYIADKVLGKEPVEFDVAKALVEKLSQ